MAENKFNEKEILKMTKTERIFDMLQLIHMNPGMYNIKDLSKLCDVSERAIYRYRRSLTNAGITIRLDRKQGGYKLLGPYWKKVLAETDPEEREAIILLVRAGMATYTKMATYANRKVRKHGMELLKLLDGRK